MKFDRNSGLFKKYLISSISIVLFSFIIVGMILIVVIPSIWMNDRLENLKENTISVADNTKDVLMSNYLGSSNRNAIIMICNSLTQISDAIDSDIFVVNESGKVVYCRHILDPSFKDQHTYNGQCLIHDEYTIPESILETLSSGTVYSARGKMNDVLASNSLITACPIMINGEFRGAVIATQQISNILRVLLLAILRVFFLSSIIALLITIGLTYLVTYKLVKPLHEMSTAAKQYANGDFSKRITVSHKFRFFKKKNEIDELADSFNSMATALSSQELSRRSFVSNVSHELKTPMTTIGGFIDGILDGTISKEEHSKYLKIVSDEVKRLSRLVTGMLNMSKIEAGQLDINPTEFDINDMIFRTLLSFEQVIENKNIDIRGLEEFTENHIIADKDMINQVIYNIIDNAVKFTPEGGYIEIISKTDPEKTIIKIINSGKGISEEDLEKIFERFYKIDKSRSYDTKGAGMGLYIVKQLIELHGGHISARSKINEFTEFIFDIPKTIQ